MEAPPAPTQRCRGCDDRIVSRHSDDDGGEGGAGAEREPVKESFEAKRSEAKRDTPPAESPPPRRSVFLQKGAPTEVIEDEESPMLLDIYELGDILGQGAFGVVYTCQKAGTSETFAVKMVDQVETPLPDIEAEVNMLRKLSHPCVIKLYDVYYEKVFVCMVLELYKGGDLISGMLSHWDRKGMIPMDAVRDLTQQMWQAIAWIHSNSCVHRDIKGDNFMMDCPDLANKANRLYLSDFGTVCELKPGARLSSQVGTNNYWPPEMYKQNYGLKVDCWAVGVVMWGLCTGRFPFNTDKEVKHKQLIMPRRAGKNAALHLMSALERDEIQRFEADQALSHVFVVGELASFPSGPTDEVFRPEVKESGARPCVKDRRLELVDRLQHARGVGSDTAWLTVRDAPMRTKFEIIARGTGKRTTYEWLPASEVRVLCQGVEKARLVNEEDSKVSVTKQSIGKLLISHKISIDGFGKGQAKAFDELVSEVQSGQSQLLLDATKHQHLVRVVDVVLLRLALKVKDTTKYLIEVREQFPDGRVRSGVNQIPGNKKAPHENARMAVERLCRDVLNMSDCGVQLSICNVEEFEETEMSPSYPGVQTVYRKQLLNGVVTTTSPAILARIGASKGRSGFSAEGKNPGHWRTYAWMSEKECAAKLIKLKAPAKKHFFSSLVYPPTPCDHEEVEDYLKQNNQQLGKEGYSTFTEELSSGEATLVKQEEGDRLVRVVDIVVLRVQRGSGPGKSVLVEVASDAPKKSCKGILVNSQNRMSRRLPAVKRRSVEHQLLAAKRLVSKTLDIPENCVSIDHTNVRMLEEEHESANFDGLPTLYRKRFMTAMVSS